MKAVLLDFDGVVADTMPMLTRLGTFVISAYFDCPRHSAMEIYKSTCGLPFIEQLRESFPQGSCDIPAAYFEGRKTELMSATQPFPDIPPLLRKLRSAGLKVGLASSTRRAVIETFLLKHKLHFDWVGSIEEGSKSIQLRVSAGAFGMPLTDITFLGDSERDEAFAANARVAFRRVTPKRDAIQFLMSKCNASRQPS